MARRVTATFGSREAADRAAAALANMGADRDHISTLARSGTEVGDTQTPVHAEGEHFVEPAREVGDSGAALTTTDEHDVAQGAAAGAAIGAVAGIAAGLAMIIVPGFGPVIGGGALAWALGGAVGTAAAGAVAGGVYGGLRDIGIEEHHARTYEERVREGDVLLTAVVPEFGEDRIRRVLEDYGAAHITFTTDTSTWTPTAGPMSGAATGYPSATTASSAPAFDYRTEEEYAEEAEEVEPRRS